MATVQDFISTYLGLEQLMLQRRQAQVAEQNAAVNRMAVIQGLSQQMNQAGAVADLAGFAQQQGGLQGNIQNMLQGTVPGEGTTRRGLEAEGAQALSPDRRGQLAEEAVTRSATGQSVFGVDSEQFLNDLLDPNRIPNELRDQFSRSLMTRMATGQNEGQFALSGALSRLPEAELEEGAGIELGTRLSAGNQLQAEIAAAGNRLQWADMTQRGALAEADLGLRTAVHEFNTRLGLLKLQADSQGDVGTAASLQNIASMLRNMEQDKGTMSEFTADMYLRTLQAEFDRLRERGYEAPDWSEVTVEGVLNPSPFSAIGMWWANQMRKIAR